MCHSFVLDASFYEQLTHLDKQIAQAVQAKGCPYCGGVLHRADYPRKPRGVPRSVLGPGYASRLSFCCAREGCRRRTTPASVRFPGRRVYLGVLVVLQSMLKGSEASARCGQASQRTLQRWRQWWRGRFIESRFWQQARAWLSPPVCESRLPGSVLERFNGETLGRRLSRLLHWLSPITGATATEGVTTDSLREADVTQKMSLGSAGRRF